MFTNVDLQQLIFGRLTLDSIPYEEPILVATFIVVAIVGLGVLWAVTRAKAWGYLWSEWFTSIDHKKIGIMYVVLAIVMLLRGFADALMMLAQKAIAFATQRRLPAAPPLRPDFHRPRRHHDLFRGDAAHHRAHELRHAAADRRP